MCHTIALCPRWLPVWTATALSRLVKSAFLFVYCVRLCKVRQIRAEDRSTIAHNAMRTTRETTRLWKPIARLVNFYDHTHAHGGGGGCAVRINYLLPVNESHAHKQQRPLRLGKTTSPSSSGSGQRGPLRS